MTQLAPDPRDDLFEAARFIATRRGPDAHKAMRAATEAMCAVERLTSDLQQAREEIARLRQILDINTSLAVRHRSAAVFYASLSHSLGEEYLELAEHVGGTVERRPPC